MPMCNQCDSAMQPPTPCGPPPPACGPCTCMAADHDMAKRHYGEALKHDPDHREARTLFNKVCVCRV